MHTYKARGIILHTVRYGDTSMIVYVLTDVLGRQNYLVQGVRSANGRGNKGALFQPLFLVEFEGYRPPRGELHRMRDVHSFLPLHTVPFDARKSTVSLFMAEALYRLVRETECNVPLFDFVCRAVETLDRMEDGVANFHLWFLVRMSAFLGFYPGNEYMAGGCFDVREGLFSPWMPQHRIALSPEYTEILHRMMMCGEDSLGEIKLSRHQRAGFLNGMLTYFGYHLDTVHQIRSVEILREVF